MWHIQKYSFVVISFKIFLFVICTNTTTTSLSLVQNLNSKLLNHFENTVFLNLWWLSMHRHLKSYKEYSGYTKEEWRNWMIESSHNLKPGKNENA